VLVGSVGRLLRSFWQRIYQGLFWNYYGEAIIIPIECHARELLEWVDSHASVFLMVPFAVLCPINYSYITVPGYNIAFFGITIIPSII